MCLMCLMNPVSYAKKKQEQMEMYDQKKALLNALGVGEVSRVPRPQSSPPPGVGNRRRIARTATRIQELQRALVRREAVVRESAVRVRGGMIRVMPSKHFKGKVKAEEKARPSLPPSSKAGPPRGVIIRRPNSKGAPHPWHRNKRAAVKVIFV